MLKAFAEVLQKVKVMSVLLVGLHKKLQSNWNQRLLLNFTRLQYIRLIFHMFEWNFGFIKLPLSRFLSPEMHCDFAASPNREWNLNMGDRTVLMSVCSNAGLTARLQICHCAGLILIKLHSGHIKQMEKLPWIWLLSVHVIGQLGLVIASF